jgi:hypothetical protein
LISPIPLPLSTHPQSEDLPAKFSFSKVPHFSVHPPSGRLLPLQSMEIRASFQPKNLGEFRGQLELIQARSVADGSQ